MPFTRTGTDVEMVPNPRTGRLDFQWGTDGNPVYSDTESHRVATLLLERRGGWIQDATGQRGSVLAAIRTDRTRTASEIEAAARDALEKAVREGWIKPNPTIEAVRLGSGVYRLRVTYQTPDGFERVVEV